jgi:spoIIIJ-associated protein
MIKSIEISGKSEEEAVALALQQLGLTRDEVSIEIMERAKSGFLGIGSQRAVVKVTYEVQGEPEPPAAARAEKPVKADKGSVKKPETAAVRTDEAQGETTETIREFLSGLLSRMGIDATLKINVKEDGGIVVELSGPGMGSVIGRRGETLDAIQHLTNYAVNRGVENRKHISIDAENYRSKREESLVRLAEKMAEKALKYKRSMALEPMNSYERHVIHTALQDYKGVTTNSTGTEPNRRVVISLERV